MHSNQRRLRLAMGLMVVMVGTVGASSCSRVGREWAMVARHLGLGTKAAPGLPAASLDDGLGANARNSKVNREILREMYFVVLDQDPARVGSEFKGEFVRLVEVLNQGASFEGIYNGLTHAAEYRAVEKSAKPAAPEVLKAFTEMLLDLERALPVPTEFTAASAKPIEILSAGALEAAPPTPVTAASPKPAPSLEPPSAERYARVFAASTPFTLKRVLGDEALKLIASKRGDAQALASWYGNWAPGMTRFGTDFGLELRNRQDAAFHENWARSTTPDHVAWEVLTRIHRVLNDAGQKAQKQSQPQAEKSKQS